MNVPALTIGLLFHCPVHIPALTLHSAHLHSHYYIFSSSTLGLCRVGLSSSLLPVFLVVMLPDYDLPVLFDP